MQIRYAIPISLRTESKSTKLGFNPSQIRSTKQEDLVPRVWENLNKSLGEMDAKEGGEAFRIGGEKSERVRERKILL